MSQVTIYEIEDNIDWSTCTEHVNRLETGNETYVLSKKKIHLPWAQKTIKSRI